MIQLLTHLNAEALESELNDLGPDLQIIAIYAINQKHFAWVRIAVESEPKLEKKGKR